MSNMMDAVEGFLRDNLDEILGGLAAVDALLTARRIDKSARSDLVDYYYACQQQGGLTEISESQKRTAKDVFRVVNSAAGAVAAGLTEGLSLPVTVAAGIVVRYSEQAQMAAAYAAGAVLNAIEEARSSGKLEAECVNLNPAADISKVAEMIAGAVRNELGESAFLNALTTSEGKEKGKAA